MILTARVGGLLGERRARVVARRVERLRAARRAMERRDEIRARERLSYPTVTGWARVKSQVGAAAAGAARHRDQGGVHPDGSQG
jgi:hypothetical protein